MYQHVANIPILMRGDPRLLQKIIATLTVKDLRIAYGRTLAYALCILRV